MKIRTFLRRDDSGFWGWLLGRRKTVLALTEWDVSAQYGGPPSEHCAWCDFPTAHTERAHGYELLRHERLMAAIGGDRFAAQLLELMR